MAFYARFSMKVEILDLSSSLGFVKTPWIHLDPNAFPWSHLNSDSSFFFRSAIQGKNYILIFRKKRLNVIFKNYILIFNVMKRLHFNVTHIRK